VTIALVAIAITTAPAGFAWLFMLFAPAMIMKAHDATEAFPDQAPFAHGLLAELAAAAGIGRPRLYVITSLTPTGFVVASRQVAAVVVTDAVFDRLDRDQLRGLFALLTACLARRAVRAETAIAALALALSPLVLPSLALARWGLPGRRWYDIDRAAAALVGSDAVAATLTALDTAPADAHNLYASAVSSLYCVAPAKSASGLTQAFATQPPTLARIASVLS
jgi:Zn-dependent protease with chaperone function